ncbi:hypothetical protein D3C83_19650 [compost metagenome]
MFMILPGARLFSASVPITKPGVSTKSRIGMLNESHSTMSEVSFSQASESIAPPRDCGLLARIPTVRPSSRASPVTPAFPKRGFSSKKLLASTTVRITARTS